MPSVYIGANASPNYIFNTVDLIDGKVAGCNRIGNTAMNIDSGLWFIIKNDLTLATFGLPAVLNGDLDIALVGQGDSGSQAWLTNNLTTTSPNFLVTSFSNAVFATLIASVNSYLAGSSYKLQNVQFYGTSLASVVHYAIVTEKTS